MKEKPILFSAPMVKAIRDGRKTQTRRIVKLPKPKIVDGAEWCGSWRERTFFDAGCLGGPCIHVPCADGHDEYIVRVRPRHEVGDRLWVKETWCWCWKCARSQNPDWYYANDEDDPSVPLDKCGVKYAADSDGNFETCHPLNPKTREEEFRWQSPLFMPKWAARIWLEVTRVRAERVQDISEGDARAEGPGTHGVGWIRVTRKDGSHVGVSDNTDFSWRMAFMELWDSINGKPKPIYSKKEIVAYQSFPWSGESGTFEHRGLPHYVQANPWVWVYDFRRVGR